MRVLITGGAGFVGSSLAVAWKKDDPASTIVAADNLRRRGSELNLALFKQLDIEFVHADIRNPSDLNDLPGDFDLLIEASAEPSVQAGITSAPDYVLQTNLVGTLHCLEWARRRAGAVVFLSTSRVYSIAPLRAIALHEAPTRFEIADPPGLPGVSRDGVGETFPTHLARSLYGATKLASELILQEYVHTYNLRAVTNRCGVIAGPGQFGKVDQGVFTLWVACHFWNKPLRYTGFGGEGKQVRDLLHPLDLYALIRKQFAHIDACSGEVFNVGGGRAVSTSLLELTTHCQNVVGNQVPVGSDEQTSPVDIPLYLSDYRNAARTFDWQPQRSVRDIVEDIAHWLRENQAQLAPVFA